MSHFKRMQYLHLLKHPQSYWQSVVERLLRDIHKLDSASEAAYQNAFNYMFVENYFSILHVGTFTFKDFNFFKSSNGLVDIMNNGQSSYGH